MSQILVAMSPGKSGALRISAGRAFVTSVFDIIPREPAIGRYIQDYVRLGEVSFSRILVREPEIERREFLFSTSVDPNAAIWGRFFQANHERKFRPHDSICCRFENACVVGTDAVVLARDGAVRDSLQHINFWLPESSTEAFDQGRRIVFKDPMPWPAAALSGHFFCGFSGAWRNYAHWMTEALPRLFAYLDLAREIPDLKLLLPHFGQSSFQEQTVALCGIGEERIQRIAPREVLRFEHLYCQSVIDLFSVPTVVAQSARRMRERRGCAGKVAHAERIYLRRAADGPRTVANFDEIEPILRARQIEIVQCELLPVGDQIARLAAARIVVAEHGAGLANIMFCLPGARVLELFSPTTVQPAFWSLASICGLAYGFCVGERDPLQPVDWNASYRIDRELFVRALDAIGAC